LANSVLAASIKFFRGINHSITIRRSRITVLYAWNFSAPGNARDISLSWLIHAPRSFMPITQGEIIAGVHRARVSHACAQQCFVEKTSTLC
jgi:hypothetical protein